MEKGKPDNHIKIGVGTRVRSVINYCKILLEKNFRELNLTAMGGAIGSLILVCENLKILHPGLFQSYKILTVNYKTVDNTGKLVQQKLFPKFEVILSLDEPSEKNEGFQPPLPNDEREKLLNQLNSQNQRQSQIRGNRGFRSSRGERTNRFFRGERPRGIGRGFERGFGTRGRIGRGFRGRGFGFRDYGRGMRSQRSPRGSQRGRGFGFRGMRGMRGGNRGY